MFFLIWFRCDKTAVCPDINNVYDVSCDKKCDKKNLEKTTRNIITTLTSIYMTATIQLIVKRNNIKLLSLTQCRHIYYDIIFKHRILRGRSKCTKYLEPSRHRYLH